MKKIRVVIVEDSATIRGRLTEIMTADAGIDLVGVAANGKEGIELCERLRPDVVTMDMMLPLMSGLAATEYIMAHCPTPILIVSSSTNRGEIFKTYEALAAGAVDVLEKPFGDEPEGDWEGRLLSAVKMASRIRVITHPRGRLAPLGDRLPTAPSVRRGPRSSLKVAAIGASTGGPGAIVSVLRSIPSDFYLPILLVLHIHELFAPAFAEWLDGQTEFRAAFARDGEPVALHAGRVVMAPADRHMIVRNGRLVLTSDPPRHSCRPSVDTLFESVAREYGSEAAAAILTGMGRDGAAGLLEIRRAGGLTIAQDEATCVVYGMPREAVLLGAASRVLPLQEIGPAFAEALVQREEAVA
jgi:two-component system chemotaxis response regulator CheB